MFFDVFCMDILFAPPCRFEMSGSLNALESKNNFIKLESMLLNLN